MSTMATIAIKENNRITSIYCNYDGGLDCVGVYLHYFYKEAGKVRKLISLGGIKNLGNHLTVPTEATFLSANSTPNFDLDRLTFHAADTYTIQYSKLGMTGHELFDIHTYADELEWCKQNQMCYRYLFDTADNTWYVCEESKREVPTIKITETFSYKSTEEYVKKKKLANLLKHVENRSEIDEIKTPSINIYNQALKEKNILDVEFDYAKDKAGNKVYGLYKLGGSRRKLIVTHKYIQVLMRMVGVQCNVGLDQW